MWLENRYLVSSNEHLELRKVVVYKMKVEFNSLSFDRTVMKRKSGFHHTTKEASTHASALHPARDEQPLGTDRCFPETCSEWS